MKILRSLMVALTLGTAVSAAQAHDSFNIGISLGGHGYPGVPMVAYNTAPQVVYYNTPRVYYPAPHAYYGAPVIGYRDVYYGAPRHHFSGHQHHGGYGHPGHGHRGHYR